MFSSFLAQRYSLFLPPGYNFFLPEVYSAIYLILSLFFNDKLTRYNILH